MTSINNEPEAVLYPQDVSVVLDEMLYDQDLAAPNQEPVQEISLEEKELQAQVARDQHAYELEVRQHEMEKVLVKEEIHASSHMEQFDYSGPLMAFLTIAVIVGLAYLAQRQIYNMSHNPAPPTGVVIDNTAPLPRAAPAYPTVLVQPSNNPNQAPSPLPPAATTN